MNNLEWIDETIEFYRYLHKKYPLIDNLFDPVIEFLKKARKELKKK